MASAETTPPYDRTLVSKDLLSGDRVDETRLLLVPHGVYSDARIDLRLGVHATGVDVRVRRVELATAHGSPTTASCSPSAASRCDRRA